MAYDTGKPRGAADRAPPDGRLPLPREGPGGVPPGALAAPDRLIGNCRAQAPRPGNVGVAGRGSDRPTDWRIRPWHQRMPEAVIGLDVGKSSHWACVATRDGEVLLSAPVAKGRTTGLAVRPLPDALVVVDQSRNISALALARARAAGMSAATCSSQRTGPPGSSPATPRPTSETRWSSRRRRLASPTRSCRSERQVRRCGGGGAGRQGTS